MLDRGGFGREAPAVGRAGDRLALGKERGEIVVARLDPVGAKVERRARQHRILLVFADEWVEEVDQRLRAEAGFSAPFVGGDWCGAIGRSEERSGGKGEVSRVSTLGSA